MSTTSSAPSGSLRQRATSAPDRDAAIAHIKTQMRAPLRALQSSRTAREVGGLPPDLDQRMGQHTKSLARRLSLLLEDLVLVSSRGQERLVLELQDLRLSTQVTRAAALFPDLSIDVEGDRDASVRADSLRLQQLLANMIRIAQHEVARPIRLRVTCAADTVMLELPDVPASDGYELDLVRQLALAHGGRLGHRDGGALLVTLPLARSPRR